MDSGFYASFTGLAARMQALDVLANNIANVNTTGFKGQHEFYREVVASLNPSISVLNRAINDYGVLGGSSVDLSQGNFETTGNSLDAAIEGPGFFVAQTSQGTDLTRNGAFQLNAKRQLTTADGSLVLGEQGPISIPSGKISIGPDGTISVDGAIAGRLKIVELQAGTEPEELGGSYFSAPANAQGPAVASAVREGSLETANVNAVAGTVNLIGLQRQAELLQRALAVFDSDFNKTAVTQLPQV